MSAQSQLIHIRSRKLSLLIANARTACRRSVDECAAVMGITPDCYVSYENGSASPSLPELEALAFFLDVPLEQFWGKTVLDTQSPAVSKQTERLMRLRNRIIGAHLRMARTRVNYSLAELAAKTSIPEERIKEAELGDQPVSLPELEVLANAMNARIEDFFDQSGPVGKWHSDQQAIHKFLELPPEIQRFVCQPVNRPYLELAMRLNDLSVERLRSIAEGLLEITY